ncbi:hypothetical protein MTO96_050386 [Rhipicephalus appendiculatus]
MQRLTKPSKPPTTSTAPAVSPASCFAADTTVPTLSQPGNVNNPTPTALGQPAAFLSCTHTPSDEQRWQRLCDTQLDGHVSTDVRRYNAYDRQRIKRSQDGGTSPSRYTNASVRRHQCLYCRARIREPHYCVGVAVGRACCYSHRICTWASHCKC